MYKTDFLKVKTQILETIFAELPQTAKKVKLTIKFDDQQKINIFKKLEAQRKEVQEDGESLDSVSDQEDNQAQMIDPYQLNESTSTKSKQEKQLLIKNRTEIMPPQKIDVGLEQGIIYKQFYEKQFEKISEICKVKIKIRAQKITFQGFDSDNIEDAMEEVNELRKQIEIEYIPKNGLQMSESEMIRKKLDKVGVKIFRILDKYYRWYEISSKLDIDQQKEKRRLIKNVLSQIDKTSHCLQYLYTIDQNIDIFKGSINNQFLKLRQKFMNYRPLLEELKCRLFEKELKCRLFEKELKYKINGEANDDQLQAELSINKDAILFHSVAKQHLQMTIKQVRVQFQAYDYFYITIDSDNQIQKAIQLLQSYEYSAVMDQCKTKSIIGQIQEVKDFNYIHFVTNYQKVKKNIQERINDPAFYNDHVPKESVIFCIGFKLKYQQNKLEYLCQILEKLYYLWVGASFKFSIFLDQQEEIQDNRITYQFNTNEKLFSISANENSLETNLYILRNHVIKRKLEMKRNQHLNLENEQNNVTFSTINASQLIQDSTILNDKSITHDLSTSSILEGIKNENLNTDANIQNQTKDQDDKAVQSLKQYNIFLPETSKQYNEKYKESEVKMNQILPTDKRNRSLQQQLNKFSDSRFQVIKIRLNQNHKVQSFYQDPKRDQIITVFLSSRVSPFVKPKQIGLKLQQGLNETFPIRFFTMKQSITQNGYLINVKKKDIEIHGKSFKIRYGAKFQVAKILTYLKKI